MDQAMPRRAAPTPPRRMGREDYRAWAEVQPRGRWERVDGEVIAMNVERLGHIFIKNRVWLALERAIAVAGVACQAFGDGVTVEVGEGHDYAPDAVVNCGPLPDLESVVAPNPVVVVEVTSPSTRSIDTGDKLAEYFRVPAVQHYLVVRSRRREVLHYQRRGDRIDFLLVTAGPIALDPPGIVVAIEEFYAGLDL